jgi:hypothetical protein
MRVPGLLQSFGLTDVEGVAPESSWRSDAIASQQLGFAAWPADLS